MDWFVGLTPLLLIPILGLFAFVGCSLLFRAADPPDPGEPPEPPDAVDPDPPLAPPDDPPAVASVNIRVRFFPRSLGSTSDEYLIVISGLGPDDIAQEREPNSDPLPPAREAIYELTPDGEAPSFTVAADQLLEISCQVFEPNSGPILVASVDPHCQRTLDAGESYEVEFGAPEGSAFFGPCTVTLT